MKFPNISLLILAGGESNRMGFPKHLLPASGGTIIDHIVNRLGSMFGEVLVVGRGLNPSRADVRIIEDIMLIRSPLVGILSGMKESSNPDVFVIGCDMPFVKPKLLQLLISKKTDTCCEVVIPVVRGYLEPLCAVYNCSTEKRIKQYLETGGRKVTGFFNTVSVKKIPESQIRLCDPLLESFVNLNTPNDYQNYCLS